MYSIHFHKISQRLPCHRWHNQDGIYFLLIQIPCAAVKPVKCPENKQTWKGHQHQYCLSVLLREINWQATSVFISLLQLTVWAGNVTETDVGIKTASRSSVGVKSVFWQVGIDDWGKSARLDVIWLIDADSTPPVQILLLHQHVVPYTNNPWTMQHTDT